MSNPGRVSGQDKGGGGGASSEAGGRAGLQDWRREARRLALQCLHQLQVQNGANLEQLGRFLAEAGEKPEVRSQAEDWARGAWEDRERIDGLIGAVSTNWRIDRISQVDRSNLRLGVHQLANCREIPAKVVINEAVELAKEFSTAEAPGFVNGVLDAVWRGLTEEAAQAGAEQSGPQQGGAEQDASNDAGETT